MDDGKATSYHQDGRDQGTVKILSEDDGLPGFSELGNTQNNSQGCNEVLSFSKMMSSPKVDGIINTSLGEMGTWETKQKEEQMRFALVNFVQNLPSNNDQAEVEGRNQQKVAIKASQKTAKKSFEQLLSDEFLHRVGQQATQPVSLVSVSSSYRGSQRQAWHSILVHGYKEGKGPSMAQRQPPQATENEKLVKTQILRGGIQGRPLADL